MLRGHDALAAHLRRQPEHDRREPERYSDRPEAGDSRARFIHGQSSWSRRAAAAGPADHLSVPVAIELIVKDRI